MNHKKFVGGIACLVLASVLVLAGTADAQGLGFKIRLYGGLSYLSGGDLNDGAGGLLSAYTDLAQFYHYPISGEYSPAHLGPVFGGDFILQITPMFGIGLGAGYVQASKESMITITGPSTTATIATTPKYHAVPLKLSLFLSIPSGAMTFNIHAGLGYYLAQASSQIHITEAGHWEDILSQTDSKGGIGFHGGLGLEFDLAPHVALFIEALGQYASLSGFKGTLTASSSGGGGITINGTFYYFEEKMFSGDFYPIVFVVPTAPSGSDYRNVRKASVDFSGGEILTGIVFKF